MSTTKVKKHPHAGNRGATHDFLKLLGTLCSSGSRRHSDVLDDFLELSYCAIAKTTHAADSEQAATFEARYMALVGKREPDYIRAMPELLGLASIGVGERCDFLGVISGQIGALSEHAGQFFTPYEVSSLIARMTLERDVVQRCVDEKGYIDVNEPACGAGGMLLAAADALDDLGFDPTLQMRALAVDVSATAHRMAYVQLSLRGLAVNVVRGNTLSLETFEQEVTPGMLRFRLHHALTAPMLKASAALESVEAQTFDEPSASKPIRLAQRGLFDAETAVPA